MLTTTELKQHIEHISYKPGWSFTIYDGEWEGQHVVIHAVLIDASDPTKTMAIDVHSSLPPMPSYKYFDRWLMWRLARIEVHEVREFFRVEGLYVDNPHAEFAERDNPDYQPPES